MDVLVTGATGFIGKALILRLLAAGHRPLAHVRSPARARASLGPAVELVSGPDGLRAAVGRVDGVVNLAGAPVLPRRWTAARRRELVASRVGTTRALVEAIRGAGHRPRVLVSASAVGYYGDRGEEVLGEASAPGTGFLAGLCRDWEREALDAEGAGVRVVVPRIGVVLGPEGGALPAMLPLFRLGLGGPYGAGLQYLSWIHLADLAELLVTALADARWSGPVNAVAPHPVTGRDFARTLGRTLGRPAALPAPAFALRLALGEAASALLEGQRVSSERARALGFDFRFPTLEAALADVLCADVPQIVAAPAPPADSAYLARRPPRFLLRQETELEAPLEEVFDFFSRPENLGLLTPPGMGLRIREAPPVTSAGAVIDYELKVGPAPVRWRTLIERFEPGEGFVDSQQQGPYRSWWHEHRFREEGGRVWMEDRVWYTPPLAFASQPLVVAPKLRRIFAYRAFAIRLRYAARARPAARVEPAGPEAHPTA